MNILAHVFSSGGAVTLWGHFPGRGHQIFTAGWSQSGHYNLQLSSAVNCARCQTLDFIAASVNIVSIVYFTSGPEKREDGPSDPETQPVTFATLDNSQQFSLKCCRIPSKCEPRAPKVCISVCISRYYGAIFTCWPAGSGVKVNSTLYFYSYLHAGFWFE